MPGPAILAIDLGTGGAKVALVTVPVGPDYRGDVLATRRAINRRTVVVVGRGLGLGA